MANSQEKSKELIIFYKKNNILYLFLRNLGFFATFAGKYNISMKHSIGIITTCYTQVDCGMTQSTVLGIPTLVYLPFCFFNIISPLMSCLVAILGFVPNPQPKENKASVAEESDIH